MPQDTYSQDEYNRGKDSFNSFANTATKPLQDKANDKAKEFAKKAVEKAKEELKKKLTAKKATSTIARWILSSLTTAGITTILPIFIIIIILTILPYSIFSLLAINKNYDANNDKVVNSVRYVYNENVNTLAIRSSIKHVLDREYNCDGTIADVRPQYTDFNGGKVLHQFYYETETCKITVKLTPTATEMIPKVSAYVHAANGVIDYYSPPEELDYHVIPKGDEKYEANVCEGISELNGVTYWIERPNDYCTQERINKKEARFTTKEKIEKHYTEEELNELPVYERYTYDTSDMPSFDSAENWYKITGTDDETGLPIYESSEQVNTVLNDVYSNSNDVTEETVHARRVREALTESLVVNTDTDLPIEEFFYTKQGHKISVHPAVWTKQEEYCEMNGQEVSMSVCKAGQTTTTKVVDTCRYYGGSIKCFYKDVVSSGNVKTRTIVIHGYEGDVSLKVDYNISKYRKQELEDLFTPDTESTIVGKGRCIINVDSQGRIEGSEECTQMEATRVIHNLLFSYYRSSMTLYNSNQEINSFNDVLDFDFTAPITATGKTGTLEYPSRALDYNSIVGDYSRDSSVGRYVWNHAYDLRNAGLLGGSSDDYQCTFFAQMWFYDVYGWNSSGPSLSSSGNGNEFTQIVYDAWTYEDENGETQHYFEFADAPCAGGLISIDYFLTSGDAGAYGHIICCDEVNYEEGYIVVSEGNYNGDGAVAIRHKYTLDDFYAKHNGYMSFLAPTGKALEETGVVIKDLKES